MRTLRTIVVVGSAAVFLLSATVVFAEGQEANTSREKANSEYRAMAASTTARMQVAREEAKNRMAELRDKVEKRLTDIQDKVKQQMAQRLVVQFDNLNATWTDRFVNLLDRYDGVLQKIQSRADIAGSAGKDVASTTLAVQSARTALTTARTAVLAQAAKTYALDTSIIITKTSTSTPSGQEKLMKGLRTSFQNLHTTLFKNLFALRDGPMKNARKAVQSALETLGKIPGVDEEHATSTEKSNQ